MMVWLLKLVANLVHNTLTNYTNHVAQTEIDFPVVPLEIQQLKHKEIDAKKNI